MLQNGVSRVLGDVSLSAATPLAAGVAGLALAGPTATARVWAADGAHARGGHSQPTVSLRLSGRNPSE